MKMKLTNSLIAFTLILSMGFSMMGSHATQNTPSNVISEPVSSPPIITCDYPKPGTTSVTIYKADYLKPDGTPNSSMAFTFITTGFADAGLAGVTAGGPYMGAGAITGLPVGSKIAMIRNYYYAGFFPTGDITADQSATDVKGRKTTRSFVIHIKTVNPATATQLTPAQKSVLKIK